VPSLSLLFKSLSVIVLSILQTRLLFGLRQEERGGQRGHCRISKQGISLSLVHMPATAVPN